jgi:Flp pilus assembly pilin Flp
VADRAVGPTGNVAGARGTGCVGFAGANVMKTLLKKLITDDRGGEVLEYALIAGLIVVAAIAVITSVGTKVVAKWQSVDDGL